MRCKLYRLWGFLRSKLRNHNTEWDWYKLYGHKFFIWQVSLKEQSLLTTEKCVRCGFEMTMEDFDSGKFLKGDKGTR